MRPGRASGESFVVAKVLVVDDNVDILDNVRDYLVLSGLVVETATSGEQALRTLRCKAFDALVLDIGLPDLSGLAVCRRLRAEGLDLPVILLTARDAVDDRCEGLGAGADDYVVKPFALRELTARVLAQLRRYVGQGETLRVGDLTFDLRTRAVRRAGRALKIAPNALIILEELMRRSPAVVTRERLAMLLWGGNAPDTDALRSTVYQLRAIVDKPFETPLIATHHRVGWSLACPEACADRGETP